MALDNATINSRLLIILVVIVGLISAVSVIISSVALNRPSSPDISISTNNHPISLDWLKAAAPGIQKRDLGTSFSRDLLLEREHREKSIWTIALGFDNGAHDYRSEDGSIQGFGRDLVEAVCETLHIRCQIILDQYQNCWSTTQGLYPVGGQGLLAGWYDACAGWSVTRDRLNVFDFSSPYFESDFSKLYVKRDGNKNVDDLLRAPIGFVRGFASDERCLATATRHLATDKMIYAETAEELVKLLKSNKISAIFSSESVIAPYLGQGDLEEVEGIYTCTDGGYAVMARKDNSFVSLWNEGIEKIKKDGRFKILCEEAYKVHGKRGTIKCKDYEA